MTDALRYEMARLRTLRSTWWLLGLSVAITAAIAFAIGMAARSNDLSEQYAALALTGGAEFAPVPLTAVFAGLTGAFSFGHEYRYGTIRPALSAVPRRSNLIAAKVVVALGWAMLMAVATVAVGYLTLLVIPGQDLIDGGVPWDPIGRSAFGFVILVMLWGVVGLSFAGILRNLPLAIVLLLVIPMVVEGILFAVLQFVPALDGISWLSKYLPFTAGTAMVAVFSPSDFDQSTDFDTSTPLQGGLTFAVFALAVYGLCWALFHRRDA